jgi:hypothetical protein
MSYQYTTDPPSNDPAENRRLGYRTPRSILLPPYLEINPYFTDFMDAVDEVFETTVDKKTEILGNLRNMWVTNPEMEATYINESQLIPFEAWSQPERDLLVKQVNALGMKLQNAGVVTSDNYQTISRWVGQYWFGKGTESFINFINYCLSTSLDVRKQWTQDYVNFYDEGDPTIGTAIWDGGTWYPTTHVAVIASGGLEKLDIKTLVSFFYEIANYNLVLESVRLDYKIPVVDHLEAGYTDAKVVAIGLWGDSAIVLSNTMRMGVDSPPIYDTAPNVPSGALMSNPAATDYTSIYMLSQPTAWIQDQSGNKLPAYTLHDQAVSNTPTLPTTLCGGASTTGTPDGYKVLYGPVGWIPVPGSSRSDARLPVYTVIPTARTGTHPDWIPSQVVGNQRANLLVNPKGFKEVVPGSGQFTPYW